MVCFFFNGTGTTEIYTYCHTLSLPAALPISGGAARGGASDLGRVDDLGESAGAQQRAIGRRRAGGAGAGEVDAERQHRVGAGVDLFVGAEIRADRKSTRLNSSH